MAVTHWRRGTALAAAALVLVNVGVLGFMPGATPVPVPTNTAASTAASSSVSASVPARAAGPGNPTPKPAPSDAPRPRVTLVGDSVLLGASPYLVRRLPAASVEAKVGRQGGEGLKLVQSLRDQAQLGETAVIHLGTNGYLSEKQFRALLEELADRRAVVVVNVYGARRWTRPNNELMARVISGFDNVRLVDWHAIGQANPDYFVQDGIHLSGIGIHAYYSQIRMALGLPEVTVAGPALRELKRPLLPKPSPSPAPSGADTASAPTALTARGARGARTAPTENATAEPAAHSPSASGSGPVPAAQTPTTSSH